MTGLDLLGMGMGLALVIAFLAYLVAVARHPDRF